MLAKNHYTKADQRKNPPSNLGETAVAIAAEAARIYLDRHNLAATPEALSATLRSWVKSNLAEALRDAKDALDANMLQAAEITFKASMVQAGIEAAKEAGFPREKLGNLNGIGCP